MNNLNTDASFNEEIDFDAKIRLLNYNNVIGNWPIIFYV